MPIVEVLRINLKKMFPGSRRYFELNMCELTSK